MAKAHGMSVEEGGEDEDAEAMLNGNQEAQAVREEERKKQEEAQLL